MNSVKGYLGRLLAFSYMHVRKQMMLEQVLALAQALGLIDLGNAAIYLGEEDHSKVALVTECPIGKLTNEQQVTTPWRFFNFQHPSQTYTHGTGQGAARIPPRAT